MAREVGIEKTKPTTLECDLCREKQGRNATVVHILSFKDPEMLKRHLAGVFGKTNYCQEYFMTLWSTARHIYGHVAREKQQPLWLVYLEAHGVTVKGRAEAIMNHRKIFAEHNRRG